MGDVAMLMPCLYAVARANPEHEFTLLTQVFLGNLLLSPPPNLEVMVLDLKGEERNLWGLCQYVARLRRERFDLCLDMHDVLRSKFIRYTLGLSTGIETKHIHKPRTERKRLLRPEGEKDLSPLPSMLELYMEVFRSAGLRVPSEIAPISIKPEDIDEDLLRAYPELMQGEGVLGFAPFASTESKTYDLDLSERLVALLSQSGQWVYLFGSRGKEEERLAEWAERYPRVRSLAGKLELNQELRLMSCLRLMISMDSANMHLASMLGVPVLSLWCATHSSAGFLGLGQSLEHCMQSESLGCRPCSIFGVVRSCIKGDMPCRRAISPEDIARKVEIMLELKV